MGKQQIIDIPSKVIDVKKAAPKPAVETKTATKDKPFSFDYKKWYIYQEASKTWRKKKEGPTKSEKYTEALKQDQEEKVTAAKKKLEDAAALSFDEWKNSILEGEKSMDRKERDDANYYLARSRFNKINTTRALAGLETIPEYNMVHTDYMNYICISADMAKETAEESEVKERIPRSVNLFFEQMIQAAQERVDKGDYVPSIVSEVPDGFYKKDPLVNIDGMPRTALADTLAAALAVATKNIGNSEEDILTVKVVSYLLGVIDKETFNKSLDAKRPQIELANCICRFFSGSLLDGTEDSKNQYQTKNPEEAIRVAAFLVNYYRIGKIDMEKYSLRKILKRLEKDQTKLGFGVVKDTSTEPKKVTNKVDPKTVSDPAAVEAAAKAAIITKAEKFFAPFLNEKGKEIHHQFNILGDLLEVVVTRPDKKVESYVIDPGDMMGLGYAVMCNVPGDVIFVPIKHKEIIKKAFAEKAYILTDDEIKTVGTDMFPAEIIYQLIDFQYGWKVLNDTKKPEDREYLTKVLMFICTKLPWNTNGLPATRVRFDNWKSAKSFDLVCDNKCKSPFQGSISGTSTLPVSAVGLKIEVRDEDIKTSYNGISYTFKIA